MRSTGHDIAQIITFIGCTPDIMVHSMYKLINIVFNVRGILNESRRILTSCNKIPVDSVIPVPEIDSLTLPPKNFVSFTVTLDSGPPRRIIAHSGEG